MTKPYEARKLKPGRPKSPIVVKEPASTYSWDDFVSKRRRGIMPDAKAFAAAVEDLVRRGEPFSPDVLEEIMLDLAGRRLVHRKGARPLPPGQEREIIKYAVVRWRHWVDLEGPDGWDANRPEDREIKRVWWACLKAAQDVSSKFNVMVSAAKVRGWCKKAEGS